MHTRRNILKSIIGGIALIFICILAIKLVRVPMFMLPPIYSTVMFIVGMVMGSLIIAGIIKAIFKKASFFIAFCFIILISSAIFLSKLYSPTLIIVVPKGYVGEVSLVLANVDHDILSLDSNGIGYITKRTFDRVYTKPVVREKDGLNISDQIVGFNPSTFWAKGSFSNAISEKSSPIPEKMRFLSFEIVPKDKKGQKQYYSSDLIKLVDKTKLYRQK